MENGNAKWVDVVALYLACSVFYAPALLVAIIVSLPLELYSVEVSKMAHAPHSLLKACECI
jgi:hypothetical protein